MAVVAGEGPVPGSELALKGDVLGLLLSHPGGVPLWDFGRLFRQHHGRRLDLARHGYRSLRHLLGDMKELVVLDEEGEEPRVRCWHPACAPRLGAEPPKRPLRPRRVHKAASPKQQRLEAPKTAPRPWNSCHHLAAPPAAAPVPPPARSAPGHRARAQLPRAASLSHVPGSRLPVAAPRPPPLLTFANQPLGLAAYGGAPLNSSAPAPSRLPRPASPRLDPAARSELEQKVARVLGGHPGGISLFRFRQAYSAAYCDPFPLDSSASVKEQLAAMPGAVRVEGWGVQTLLFPVCPQEPPGASEETGLPPSLPEAASLLASPAAVPAAPAGVCPSPASPLEAQEGGSGGPEASPAGPDRPPVPCSPPPGHGVAAGAPAELPSSSAARCSPMTRLEHETMAPIAGETVVLEAVTMGTAAAGAAPPELEAELPLPPDLASSAPPSSVGSPSALTPPLSLGYEVGTDAILYSLNSAPRSPSCLSPEPSFPPILPGPTSGDQSPLALVSPGPAWSPIQGISGAADSPTVRTPVRPLPLSEPGFVAPYKQGEGGAPWAAIKPEPHLPPVSPSRPLRLGSKGKPSKRKKDACVLL